MANISQNVNIEMLEKLPDGTYKRKYPKTRSDTGVTFDEHLADIASQDVGKGADIIGLPDPNNLFTATNVGGAMQELFTNVSNGKNLVGGAITDVDDSVVIPTDPTFQQLADSIRGINKGGIKTVQRGTTVINNVSSLNVSIASVDLNKAIVKITSVATGTTYAGPSSRTVRASLTSPTNINLAVNEASPVGTIVEWEVIEFEGVKSLQRGTISMSYNTTRTVNISAVNMNKSILFISHNASGSETVGYILSGKLATPTTIELRTLNAASVHWQLLELE